MYRLPHPYDWRQMKCHREQKASYVERRPPFREESEREHELPRQPRASHIETRIRTAERGAAGSREGGGVYHGLAGPVELAVVHVAAPVEQVTEHAPQLVVVRRLEEVQPAHVAQVRGQLLGVPLAQHLDIHHKAYTREPLLIYFYLLKVHQ